MREWESQKVRGKGGFCREKKREKSYEECEKVREIKRMKKKKKRLITIGGKNEKAGTHLMAKLCVV